MGTTTKEIQVANLANSMIALVQSASALQQQIDLIASQWTNLGAANALNAFPTAPLLTTGALGVADTNPVTGNPIDIRTTDGALLNRALSASQLASVMTYLNGVSAATKGTAVSLNGAAAQLVAACL